MPLNIVLKKLCYFECSPAPPQRLAVLTESNLYEQECCDEFQTTDAERN